MGIGIAIRVADPPECVGRNPLRR